MSTGAGRDVSDIPNDPKDWLLDDEELDELLDHLADVEIVTTYDIPYTAGYSVDGKTIYIDKEVPQYIKVRKLGSKLTLIDLDVWKAFTVHEAVEKSLEDDPYNWKYKFSHQIALRAERAYVQSIGADFNDYNHKTLDIVKKVWARKTYPNIPPDLDPAPYLDWRDKAMLKQFPNAEALLELDEDDDGDDDADD